LKDARLEKLAGQGDGHYGYVDGFREARRVFVEEMAGTLQTVAKDVKLQVEFNPARVGAYRLIGYENRVMAARDFNNDKKDAGDVGAGHSVTALYEIAPLGKGADAHPDDLKYRSPAEDAQEKEASGERQPPSEFANELLTVKLRYKLPDADESTKQEFPLVDPIGQASAELDVSGGRGTDRQVGPPDSSSRDLNWASAVAAFGMLLRDSQHKGDASFDMVLELAKAGGGEDESGRRTEFLDLVRMAKAIYAR
jgi:Ca-activated chloride channel family protein